MNLKRMDPSQTVALFGGTFDPPHLGHLEAIEGLFANPGFKEVRIIPSGNPALKTSLTSPHDRAGLTEALRDSLSPRLRDSTVLDLREVQKAGSTPSYTFDTLKSLKSEGFDSLAWVIGTDQLATLPKWHRFPEVLSLCHWIVLKRKGQTDEGKLIQSYSGQGLLDPLGSHGKLISFRIKNTSQTLSLVETPARRLSSTEIREKIALTGQIPENTLPFRVETYLKTHRLYAI